MKQQPYATMLAPSKACRLLILALTLKITVLGLIFFTPFAADSDYHPTLGFMKINSLANAAEGAGAPPPIAPIVPENPAQIPAITNPEQPKALPGITPKQDAKDEAKALPSIGAGSAQGTTETGLGKDALARRQEELARREEELRVLEKEIAAKLEQMTLLENRLSSMIKQAEELNDAKLRHLVDVMSNMKARAAAEMIETMDQRLAVKVLAGMRGRQAGEILNFVKPEIAANLTAALTRMQLPFE